MSVLITSPGLLFATQADWRRPRAWWLLGATIAVLIPTLLYYGGGWLQYGYRYFLDSVPFVIALCGLAAVHRGWVEHGLEGADRVRRRGRCRRGLLGRQDLTVVPAVRPRIRTRTFGSTDPLRSSILAVLLASGAPRSGRAMPVLHERPRTMTRQAKLQRIWRSALIFGFGVLIVVVLGEVIISSILPNSGDWLTMRDPARVWLAGGNFYPAYELDGPFIVGPVSVLYPPPMLILLVPFTFLPDIVWWLVPMAILGAVYLYWKPSLLGWTLVLVCLANEKTFIIYLWGNSAMWFAAFVALGTIYHWPSVLVFIKPTLAPFALVGIRHRSWSIALLALVAVSIAFLPMWPDYLRVFENSRGPLVSPLVLVAADPAHAVAAHRSVGINAPCSGPEGGQVSRQRNASTGTGLTATVGHASDPARTWTVACGSRWATAQPSASSSHRSSGPPVGIRTSSTPFASSHARTSVRTFSSATSSTTRSLGDGP